MPDFRTVLPEIAAPFRISHNDRLLMLGSCFTENIGAWLRVRQFRILTNPYGIVYNPVSIARALNGIHWEPADFFEQEGIWRHWELHSSLAATSPAQALAEAQSAAQVLHNWLLQTDVLILTLGTAHVFEWRTTGQVVANCHKVPAAQFHHRLLSVQETIDALHPAILRLQQLRPGLKTILTVSPVRHLRSGMVDNQRSKATLLLACAALSETLPNTFYFPAYELLMDDLRDYRFYAQDMIHPSESAIQYISERFSEAFFEENTRHINRELERIQQGFEHRPFNPDTPQHQAFVEKLKQQTAAMQQRFPWMNWGREG